MHLYNKYKSEFIATFVSLLFYGLLFLLLCMQAGRISPPESTEDNVDPELAVEIQNEPVEVLPPAPSSPSTKIIEDKKLTVDIKKEALPREIIGNEENIKTISQNSKETPLTTNNDSILLSELKKTLEAIHKTMPEDSLPVDQIQKEPIQNIQQALTENFSPSNDDRQFIRNNYRTIRSLKKVYPYVQKTKEIVDKLNIQLATITSKREQRRLIKSTEKDLFSQFEKDVRGMSYSQGKLLLKLISRETNQSGYDLVKTYKGALPATFWYGVGLLFHENLKAQYDSIGEDALLEKIVLKYKQGRL